MKPVIWVGLFLLGFSAVASAETPPAAPAIRLTNYTGGETIRHPVALLVGTLDDQAATEVTLTNASSKRPTATLKGQAINGRFKVLAELVPGENRLTLSSGVASLTTTINYKPQTNPYFVRIVWMTDSTGDTAYQTQLDNDKQDFRGKLDTAMKLMQTLTAERMHDLGYGRQTFNMELDDDGRVKVHVQKGKRAATEYYALEDQRWYGVVADEMRAAFASDRPAFAKNIVIAAYTRFDPQTGKAQGHTALGGGNQGLFGSGNVFTWPSSLQEVQPAFMNNTRMDKSKVQDDSSGRGTMWGAASTTIGATLHEMGHAFDLPHTTVRLDVMTRGFDHFNRVFTVAEPRRDGSPNVFRPDDVAMFAPISAESLLTSRWFALDDRRYAERGDVDVRLSDDRKTVIVRSSQGVRYVSARVKGNAVFHRSPPRDQPAPKEFAVPVAEIRKVTGEGEIRLRGVDADGFSKSFTLKD